MVAMKINLHNVAYVLTLFFLTTVVVTNGLDLKTKYVKYNEDGEPEHFHIDLSKNFLNLIILQYFKYYVDI